MKKTTLILAAIAALMAVACARTTTVSSNELAAEYFEKWVKKNYPDAEKTELGAYVLDSWKLGSEPVGNQENSPYILVNYTVRNINGKYLYITSEKLAKQLDDWRKEYYFGPRIWTRKDNALVAGVDETIEKMCVGDSVSIAIPAWLQTSTRYENPGDYLKAEFSGTTNIFNVKVLESIKDTETWEKDSVWRYVSRNYPGTERVDSCLYFFTSKPTDLPDSNFVSGDRVYINYTGRLLNGTIFDTTVREEAYEAGNPGLKSSYAPTYITWAESADGLTMGSGSSGMITGFANAIFRMKPHEKATVIFWSGYGYSTSSSGDSAKGYFVTIPACSPLRFDIEIVDKPE